MTLDGIKNKTRLEAIKVERKRNIKCIILAVGLLLYVVFSSLTSLYRPLLNKGKKKKSPKIKKNQIIIEHENGWILSTGAETPVQKSHT